ncbi:MAG TPA: glycosyltransferase, partial [Lacunisphaera sp.]|nr:glycosyltransferase [Lacunisphaera sp.]
QRVRVSLPYFVAAGWDVTVLTVADPTPVAPVDPELLGTIPRGVRVIRACCASRTWTRWLGVNNVALRALPALFWHGCRLLAGRRHDVVYFSTTMFIVLAFGRIWRALYRVPCVVDLQDPWVTDFYERPGAPTPPGGWKYRVARRLGLLLEGWAMRGASHLITVSAAYGDMLRVRYPDLSALPVTELPFAAPEPDLRHLRETSGQRPAILPRGGFRLAFAGAIGPGMLGTIEVLFAAMSAWREEGAEVSAHFYGTSYAPSGHNPPVTLALAAQHGLADCVHEQPARLPYLSALQVSLEADANLILGSTDLAFTPSKILAIRAADRPILALAHAGSALAARLTRLEIPFIALSSSAADRSAAIQAALACLRQMRRSPVSKTLSPLPAEFSAARLADAQMEVLASVSTART